MIKTKDLRLGNYVTDNSGFIMYVVGIYENTVLLNFEGNEGDVFETNVDCLQPIKLTEELLLKCGFTFDNNSYLSPYYNDFKKVRIFGYDRNYRYVINKFEGIYIKYLHQLQNLFYTLTQKELELEFKLIYKNFADINKMCIFVV